MMMKRALKRLSVPVSMAVVSLLMVSAAFGGLTAVAQDGSVSVLLRAFACPSPEPADPFTECDHMIGATFQIDVNGEEIADSPVTIIQESGVGPGAVFEAPDDATLTLTPVGGTPEGYVPAPGFEQITANVADLTQVGFGGEMTTPGMSFIFVPEGSDGSDGSGDDSDGQATAPTVGEIAVDSYDCDTGQLTFHVPVTDLPHIPDSNGAVGYSIVGHYDQGTDSELPGQSFNVEPENSPFTGELTLGSQVPPTNDVFLPEESEEPTGSIESIDIFVGVGYDGSPGPPNSSSTTYTVNCGDATVPTSPEGDDGDDADTDGATDDADTDSGSDTEASAGDEAEDAMSEDGTDTEAASSADADETGSGGTTDTEATSGTNTDDVAELPNTGAGMAVSGSASIVLVTLLSSVAVLCGFAALRIRRQA